MLIDSACLLARAALARRCTVISGTAGAHYRPLRAKRDNRYFCPPSGAKIDGATGEILLRREHSGSERQYRNDQAARAAPDGYTVLFAFSSHVVNPSLFAKIPYDPYKDFEPVTLAVTSTAVISVNPAVPAKTLPELIDLIRANPGKYRFASPGAGTQAHLAGEQLRVSLGLDLVHVPYNGAGPAIASVVAGHTAVGVSTLASAGPHLREGKLRALAITADTRSQLEPDVPTTTELGYPQVKGDSWVGVLVPTGTPRRSSVCCITRSPALSRCRK